MVVIGEFVYEVPGFGGTISAIDELKRTEAPMGISFFCPDLTESDGSGIDLSGSSAFALLRLVGETPDYCGHWESAQLPNIRRAILEALNVEAKRAPEREEPYQDGIVIGFGRDDEKLVYLLRQLDSLVCLAQAAGANVHWG